MLGDLYKYPRQRVAGNLHGIRVFEGKFPQTFESAARNQVIGHTLVRGSTQTITDYTKSGKTLGIAESLNYGGSAWVFERIVDQVEFVKEVWHQVLRGLRQTKSITLIELVIHKRKVAFMDPVQNG